MKRAPAKHFNDMTPAEQEAVLASVHPSLLTSGIWVSSGAPTEEELAWWCNLPGADAFRRDFARLMRTQLEASA